VAPRIFSRAMIANVSRKCTSSCRFYPTTIAKFDFAGQSKNSRRIARTLFESHAAQTLWTTALTIAKNGAH
jgi:hypothetical protein